MMATTETPCHASEQGCGYENVVGIALIVLLACAIVLLVSAWVWSRWKRGPFWLIMNLLAKWPWSKS
jgi:hypothetical protein